MNITSYGIVNGVIQDKYGKRGEQFNEVGIPTYSLPVKIKNAPEKTVSYALVLEDKDAVPVVGFSWIHWLASDITKEELKENESISAKDFVQGINSWCSPIGNMDRKFCIGYGGMTPPNAPHIYELHVFALDVKLNLKDGFYMNELYKAMEGHILEKSTLKGIYNN
ncbi:phosphatidylethanolamine-binding protein [Clostridium acetobutylicum]|nr:phosphatidylethanolamine-binding protein [Clostridium acetobutylicum]